MHLEKWQQCTIRYSKYGFQDLSYSHDGFHMQTNCQVCCNCFPTTALRTKKGTTQQKLAFLSLEHARPRIYKSTELETFWKTPTHIHMPLILCQVKKKSTSFLLIATGGPSLASPRRCSVGEQQVKGPFHVSTFYVQQYIFFFCPFFSTFAFWRRSQLFLDLLVLWRSIEIIPVNILPRVVFGNDCPFLLTWLARYQDVGLLFGVLPPGQSSPLSQYPLICN